MRFFIYKKDRFSVSLADTFNSFFKSFKGEPFIKTNKGWQNLTKGNANLIVIRTKEWFGLDLHDSLMKLVMVSVLRKLFEFCLWAVLKIAQG